MGADGIADLQQRVAPSIPAAAFPAPRGGCTSLCGLALLAIGTLVFLGVALGDPLELLDRPTGSAFRFIDRRLPLDAAFDAADPAGRRALWLIDPAAGSLDAAAAAALLEEVRRFVGPTPDLLGCTAVLRAASGNLDAARPLVERLRDEAPPLAAAITWGFLEGDVAPPAGDVWTGNAEPLCRDALARAVAARDGDGAAVAEIDARFERAGTRALERASRVAAVRLGLVAAGLVVGLGWLVGGGRGTRVATALVEAAWPPALGTAVLVRGGFWAVAITLLVFGVGEMTESPLPGMMMPALIAALPLYGLVQHHLLRPQRRGWLQAFGLWPRGAGLARAALWTLPVFAFDQLGRIAIEHGGHAAGLVRHWSELLAEDFVWAPPTVALLAAVNFVVWVPFSEEIGFRGVLYGTLRSRVAPTTATLLSAALFATFQLAMTAFAAFHFSSPVALAAAFWSGLVWALAYERTRSLVPGLLAHLLANLLPAATSFLLFG